MLALGMWQDYPREKFYIKQTAIQLWANKETLIPPGKKATLPLTLTLTPDSYQLKQNIIGHNPCGLLPKQHINHTY